MPDSILQRINAPNLYSRPQHPRVPLPGAGIRGLQHRRVSPENIHSQPQLLQEDERQNRLRTQPHHQPRILSTGKKETYHAAVQPRKKKGRPSVLTAFMMIWGMLCNEVSPVVGAKREGTYLSATLGGHHARLDHVRGRTNSYKRGSAPREIRKLVATYSSPRSPPRNSRQTATPDHPACP
jgi:hypothetical protein